MTKGDTIPINVMDRKINLVVISTNPSSPVIINNSAEIIVSEESSKAAQISQEAANASFTYGVLVVWAMQSPASEMIELHLRHPELLKRLVLKLQRAFYCTVLWVRVRLC